QPVSSIRASSVALVADLQRVAPRQHRVGRVHRAAAGRNAGVASSSDVHPAVAADRLLYAAPFGTNGPATVGALLDAMVDAAGDAVARGDGASLADLVATRPSLVFERSPLGHAATLLHYVAANGVEFRRQQSGPGAPVVAERLLSAGAVVDALANTYGGGTS